MRVAEQLDHLGVAYIEGGWPGANPKDTEFFPGRQEELTLATATLVAFGSTRRAGVQRRGGRGARATSSRPDTEVVCLVAKSWDRHVDEALRTTLDEGVAMVRGLGRVPPRQRPAGLPRRRALLRRLPQQPGLRSAGPRRRRAGGGRERSCSATPTAGRSPMTSTPSWPRPAARLRRPARHPLPQRRRRVRWPTRSPLCRPGSPRCRAASTATASGRATPTCRPQSRTWPQAQRAHHPGGAPRAADPGVPPHRRAGQHRPRPPAALCRLLGLRPQGAGCTRAPSPAAVTSTSTSHPTSVGNGTRVVVSEHGRSLDAGDEGRAELGHRARSARCSVGCSTSSSGSSTRATTSRWPTGRSSCCCAGPTGWRPEYFRSSPSG